MDKPLLNPEQWDVDSFKWDEVQESDTLSMTEMGLIMSVLRAFPYVMHSHNEVDRLMKTIVLQEIAGKIAAMLPDDVRANPNILIGDAERAEKPLMVKIPF